MNQGVEAEPLYSAQWWQSRTNDELQQMVRAGFMLGEQGMGAHREIERRARELEKGDEREAAIIAAQKETLRLKILSSLLILALIVLAATVLL